MIFWFQKCYQIVTLLVAVQVPSVATSEWLWLHDFCLADPTHAMVFLVPSTLLILIEIGGASDGLEGQGATMAKRMKWLFRCFAGLLAIAAWKMPVLTCIYWLINNSWSCCQAFLMKQDAVRKVLKLPSKASMKQMAQYAAALKSKGQPVGGMTDVARKFTGLFSGTNIPDVVPTNTPNT